MSDNQLIGRSAPTAACEVREFQILGVERTTENGWDFDRQHLARTE